MTYRFFKSLLHGNWWILQITHLHKRYINPLEEPANYLLPHNKITWQKNRRRAGGCNLILQIRSICWISLIFAMDLTRFFFFLFISLIFFFKHDKACFKYKHFCYLNKSWIFAIYVRIIWFTRSSLVWITRHGWVFSLLLHCTSLLLIITGIRWLDRAHYQNMAPFALRLALPREYDDLSFCKFLFFLRWALIFFL